MTGVEFGQKWRCSQNIKWDSVTTVKEMKSEATAVFTAVPSQKLKVLVRSRG